MAASQDELPRMSDLSGSLTRFTNWLNNFDVYLTAHVADPIGVAAGGAGAAGPPETGLVLINDLAVIWNAAYGLAMNVATRNHANIIALQQIRTNPGKLALPLGAGVGAPPGIAGGMVGVLRSLIRKIQGAGTVSAAALGNAGLTPHIKRRSLPQIPTAGPELTLDKSPPHTMVVRYSQENKAEASKKKPPGCKGILLKWVCANGSSGSQFFSKCPCVMDVGAQNSGQRISVQGTWVMGNSKESFPGNTILAGVP